MTLETILAGGIGASLATGIFTLIQVLFSKKLRTPADEQAKLNSAIIERNQIITDLRTDVATLKKEHVAMNTRMEALEDENTVLKTNALARDAYIYRCITVIRSAGLMIPEPVPNGIFP